MISNEHYLTLPYRPGVGMMVVNSNNQCFVGKRVDTKADAWQMPQGGIDGEENPAEAALRELYEETGIKSVRIIAETKLWYYYDLPDYLINKLWDGKYRGQKQKWFLMEFFGDEKQINLEQGPITEFLAWRWVDVISLQDIIIPFKKKLY
ncbi:MAG: RNA pyrophosphohydrolase, partial [Pseudomonadota bacterium]